MTPKEQIIQTIQKGKMSGSWLISGPLGVGKKQFASAWASFLTTGIWQANDSYNQNVKWIECGLTDDAKKEIQKMILAGKSVEETDKTTARKREITVDDIREGIQFLSLKPAKNEYRILIINRADDMNPNAANALLKVLEEPYPQSVIILLSQNTGKLLPTIVSRCRKITLPLLSFEEIVAQLSKSYPECKYIDLIAELSNGSIGLAHKIYEMNGIELYQKLTEFCVPFQEVDIEKLSDFTDLIVKNEDTFQLFCIFLEFKLSRLIKQNMEFNPTKAENLLEIFEESQKLFTQVDSLYLDKKQIATTILLSISEELKDD